VGRVVFGGKKKEVTLKIFIGKGRARFVAVNSVGEKEGKREDRREAVRHSARRSALHLFPKEGRGAGSPCCQESPYSKRKKKGRERIRALHRREGGGGGGGGEKKNHTRDAEKDLSSHGEGGKKGKIGSIHRKRKRIYVERRIRNGDSAGGASNVAFPIGAKKKRKKGRERIRSDPLKKESVHQWRRRSWKEAADVRRDRLHPFFFHNSHKEKRRGEREEGVALLFFRLKLPEREVPRAIPDNDAEKKKRDESR